MNAQTTLLKYARKLGEDDIPVVGIFDGELPLLEDWIEIQKHFAFLLPLSDEKFNRSPMAGWLIVETAAGSL